MVVSRGWTGAERSMSVGSIEKQLLVLGASNAASRVSSCEFSDRSTGVPSSRDSSVAGDLGVVSRLVFDLEPVSSFELLREQAFLPVLCVTRY